MLTRARSDAQAYYTCIHNGADYQTCNALMSCSVWPDSTTQVNLSGFNRARPMDDACNVRSSVCKSGGQKIGERLEREIERESYSTRSGGVLTFLYSTQDE